MTRTRVALLLFLALAALLLTGLWQDVSATGGPLLHLQVATFDPLVAEPTMPHALRGESLPDGPAYYLVQFSEPIREEWRAQLVAAGAAIMDYIPDYAYLARLDAAVRERVQHLPMVRWIGPYRPGYKLDRSVRLLAAESRDLTIQLFAGEPLSPALEAMKALDVEIMSASAGELASYVRAIVPQAALVPLARLDAVCWIEPHLTPTVDNDVGGGIMRVPEAWSALALYGAGQIVCVADTGLDTGDLATLHADFRGRLLGAYALGREGDWSDPSGHGTHVAGSVLGSGAMSGSYPARHRYAGSLAGVAPEAWLIFQSLRDADGTLGGIPDDYRDLFVAPYQDGARIHTNSWSSDTGDDEEGRYGRYTAGAREVDEFIWLFKDMTILSSAGNEGTDTDRDGVVDPDSMRNPAIAKNIIAVGATESVRSGGYTLAWGEHWPDDFPERPLLIDLVSDDARGLAGFSSRGPADDGRIKPDLVAPGTNIVSVRSQAAEGDGWGSYDSHYMYLGGTSMATPLVAGAAALVRERYVRYQGLPNPSAALIRATLINGAQHTPPGQYARGPCQEIPDQHPNNGAGWGRVNVRDSIVATSSRWISYDDHTAGLTTGQTFSYNLSLAGGEARGLTFFVPLTAAEEAATANEAAANLTGCQEMIQNHGFEDGLWGWQTEGEVWLDDYAHGGRYSAWLGGRNNAEDWIWQTVYVPADATRVKVSFWFDQSTDEEYCRYDWFWVGFYSYDWESILTEVLYRDGRAWTDVWEQWAYDLSEEELAALRGQTVHLAFMMATDDSNSSSARVDDVYLQVCGAGTPPPPTPLRVTLSWSDFPGALAAAKALVNDLDLEVIAPDGHHYYGNGGTQPDRVNPTEDVVIADPLPGRYQVIVRAFQVPNGPQPYALVASGAGSGRPQDRFVQLPLVRKR